MYLYFFRFVMENSDNNDEETDKLAMADTSDKNTDKSGPEQQAKKRKSNVCQIFNKSFCDKNTLKFMKV